MATEVFRFVTVRPPQDVNIFQPNAGAGIDLAAFPSPFIDTLRAIRSDGDRSGVDSTAAALVFSAAFVGSISKLDKSYADFTVAVRGLTDLTFWAGVAPAFQAAFHTDPVAFVKAEAFIGVYRRVADSVVAAAIEASVPTKTRTLLTTLARSLWLIRRLAANAKLSRSVFLSAPLIMPPGIFPLPPRFSPGGELADRRAAAAEAVKVGRAERVAELAGAVGAHRDAVEELLTTLQLAGAQPDASGFTLDRVGLSAGTLAVLDGIGLTGTVDVAKAVPLLEHRAATLGRALHAGGGVLTKTGALVRAVPRTR